MSEQDIRNGSRAGWWGAILLVVLYLVLAILYGIAIPLFESPDASGHYSYIHELTEGRGLPVHGTPSGERVTSYVAGHTPLYYALSAAATFWVDGDVDFEDWAWRNPYFANGAPDSVGNKNFLVHTDAEAFPWRGTPLTVHISRIVSALLGAVAVAGTYGVAWEIGGAWRGGQHRAAVALGATALTAFNPMFVFIGARLSNDVAAAAFGALVLWGSVRLAMHGLSRRGLVALGASLGLVALGKLSGVTLGPVVALAFVIDTLRQNDNSLRQVFTRERLGRPVLDALLLFGVTGLVCGWWFVRNLVLYGELMGVDAWISRTATVWPEPIGFFDVIQYLQGMEMSYWAMFGWFNIAVAPWMYSAWWVLVRLAFVGLILWVVTQWTSKRSSVEARLGLAVVALGFLLNFGSVWRFLMIVPGAQGRYLFPTIAAISTLLFVGLASLSGKRMAGLLAAVLTVAHLAATVAVLLLFIVPAYARPSVVAEESLPQDLARLDLTVAGTPVQLIGGRIEVEEAHPGERVPVSVYWRALSPVDVPLVTHVRLLGKDMQRVGGTDGYPGNGSFPPTLWEPGVIYRDQYLLPIDDSAAEPTLLHLQVGMRVSGEAPLNFEFPSGEEWLGEPLLDVIPMRPAQPQSDQVGYPVTGNVGGVVTLVGANLSDTMLSSGDSFTVTLVWRAQAPASADYTIFVHLLDASGEIVTQDDAPPFEGAYPTSWWGEGDILRTPYHLVIPDDLAPGLYDLQVGMYDPDAGLRVPAADAEGNAFTGDSVPVVTLEVR